MAHQIANVNFHLLSDIHLEYYRDRLGTAPPHLSDLIEDPGSAEYLVLAGDIGNPFSLDYARFLSDCVKSGYIKVILVLGNHELYHTEFSEVLEHLDTVITKINTKYGRQAILLLNDAAYEIPNTNITLIGSIMWSPIPSQEIYEQITDHLTIPFLKTHTARNQLHDQSLTIIKQLVSKAVEEKRRAIVITHFPPSLQCCNPIYYGSPLSSAYRCDLDAYIKENPNIIAWFYGHDHHSMDIMVGETRVISNQVGLPPTCSDPSDAHEAP